MRERLRVLVNSFYFVKLSYSQQVATELESWLTKGILNSIKNRINYTNDLLKTLVM